MEQTSKWKTTILPSKSNINNEDKIKFSKTAVRKRSRDFAHRQCRIIVRNLPYKVTSKKLQEEFEKCGTIEDINILKRSDGKLVGCAFLQYEKKDQSYKAVTNMNGMIFMGRKLEVCYALPKETYKKMKTETEIKTKETKLDHDEAIETDIKEKIKEDEEYVQDITEKSKELGGIHINEYIKPLKSDRQNKHTEIEEGRTVFLKNVSYDANEDDIKDALVHFGTVEKILINKERVSGHSKGTAFVIFKLKESADMCKKQSLKVQVNNQFIEIVDALKKKEVRDIESRRSEKSGKDSRNLYLLKEGLIMAGSEAAKNVSKTDMAQRLRLEQRCAQMLKNLNRFVSRERLTVHNLPESCTSSSLRTIVQQHTGMNPQECRVMRENNSSFGNPSGKSRGYGFLSFKKHEVALDVLRKLNNNPLVFGKNNRPIVAFSIEDRKIQNIKEQRLLKSRLNNPTYQEKLKKINAKRQERLQIKKQQKKMASEQLAIMPNATLSIQKPRRNENKISKKERKRSILKNIEEFTGEISRQGKIGIRSNRKINTQADAHMERLKAEKKDARKKRVKQEHERNRQLKAARRIKPRPANSAELQRENQYFQETVGKYKEIINQAIVKNKRSKWYKG
ncbi:RNA-binding protein 28 [Wyeomyia smithii]|uniref:RNA-binding protein 28 n=1 Tax=Wyeomyia smithii TaxID=174621 RepID=UPI002467CF78|nr:RNA-binding protein 28 [Wyeomyia smithii]